MLACLINAFGHELDGGNALCRRFKPTGNGDKDLRALQEQVRVGFITETDAAMDLDGLACIGDRGIARHQKGRFNLKLCIIAGLICRYCGKTDLITGTAGGNGHVGAMMLDCLKCSNRASKLLPHSCIFDGHRQCSLRDARQNGGIDQAQAQQHSGLEPGDLLAQSGGFSEFRQPMLVVDHGSGRRWFEKPRTARVAKQDQVGVPSIDDDDPVATAIGGRGPHRPAFRGCHGNRCGMTCAKRRHYSGGGQVLAKTGQYQRFFGGAQAAAALLLASGKAEKARRLKLGKVSGGVLPPLAEAGKWQQRRDRLIERACKRKLFSVGMVTQIPLHASLPLSALQVSGGSP